MITLKIPTGQVYKDVEERLLSLSLAFKKEQLEGITAITLEDGKTVVVGKEKIQAYLDQLQGELNQWYYCAC